MWLALAAPLPLFLWTGVHGGMRQRDELVRTEGLWAIRILIAGFALSPLARLLRAPGLRRYMRTLGLFGFTYAAVHGVYYFLYGRVWEFPARIWRGRLYIPLGILCLLLLIPLAVTSADALRRKMGPAGWRRLHAVLYPLMLMIGVHAIWQSNIDYAQPAIYLALIAALLIVRLPPAMDALMRLTAGRRPRGAPARAGP